MKKEAKKKKPETKKKPKAVAVPKPKLKVAVAPKAKLKAAAAPKAKLKAKPEATALPKKAGKVQKAVSAPSKRPTSTQAAMPSGKAKPPSRSRAAVKVETVTPPEKGKSAKAAPSAGGTQAITSKTVKVQPSPTSRAAVKVEDVTPPEKGKSAKAAPSAGGTQAITSKPMEPDTAAKPHTEAKTVKKSKAPRKTPVGEKAEKKPSKKKKAESDDKALVKFDPLQRYLSEISRYKLLTREQEIDLGTRVKEQDDKDAAYVLVTANLRLVVKIALEFQRVWMQNLLDLIQEGNIGLMQAVKKFDPYKNVKFSYYASFWIKAYILKFIMDNWRLVKIGTTQGQRKLFFKLKKEKQHLIEQGFDPKPKLLSERLGVSEREIVDMDQRLDSWDVSLDAPLKNDSETERIEFLSTDSESVEDQVSKKEIELLLHNKITEFRKKMSPREIEIFELRIFSDNPVTLQEIGDRYGISRERVRQIEKNIIRKMREFLKREIPDFASYSEDTDAE
jgi:RNA polymerase sigma-32 factor